MGNYGAESEPESRLDFRELLQALVYGILILTSTVWLIIGFQNFHPAILSVHLCVGGFTAFMLARVWSSGPAVIDA